MTSILSDGSYCKFNTLHRLQQHIRFCRNIQTLLTALIERDQLAQARVTGPWQSIRNAYKRRCHTFIMVDRLREFWLGNLFKRRCLTYSQLNQASNRTSIEERCIQTNGSGPLPGLQLNGRSRSFACHPPLE